MSTMYTGKCSCSTEPVIVEELGKFKSWHDDLLWWHWLLYTILSILTVGAALVWIIFAIMSKKQNYQCTSCGNQVQPKNLISSI